MIVRFFAIHLGFALLLLAQLAFAGRGMELPQPNDGFEASAYRSNADALVYPSEQRTGPASQDGGSSMNKRLTTVAGAACAAAMNVHRLSGTQYFKATKFLRAALEVSDIIFPFHQFW